MQITTPKTKSSNRKIPINDFVIGELKAEKQEGWINIYKARSYYYGGSVIYPTEVAAKTAADADPVATIKIEWEE